MTNNQDQQELLQNLKRTRKIIDTSNQVGKKLDNYLADLAKKYGYVDKRHGIDMIRLQTYKEILSGNEQILTPLNKNIDQVFSDLGIDMEYFRQSDDFELDKKFQKAMKAVDALRASLRHDQGYLWDLYKIAEIIVDFHKDVEAHKKERTIQEQFANDIKNIIESTLEQKNKEITIDFDQYVSREQEVKELAGRIYHSPELFENHINSISKKYNIDHQEIKSKFEEYFKIDLESFVQEMQETKQELQEQGLGTFAKQQVGGLTDKLISKIGTGGAQARAQGRMITKQIADEMYRGWNKAAASIGLEADAKNLKTYLLSIGMDDGVIRKAFKDFNLKVSERPSAIKKTLSKIQLKNLFNKIATYHQQHTIKKSAEKQQKLQQKGKRVSKNLPKQDTKTSTKPVTAQDIEQAISKLPPSQRQQAISSLVQQYGGQAQT